jgi:hypothetical protein
MAPNQLQISQNVPKFYLIFFLLSAYWSLWYSPSKIYYTFVCIKGLVLQDFVLHVFSRIIFFLRFSDYFTSANSNEYEYSQRYSQLKMHHQSKTPVASLPPVPTTNLLPVSKTPVVTPALLLAFP